jgi:hypothetical protein
MNLNVYLEDGLYDALTAYSLKSNVTKNHIVRNAVKKSLQKSDKKQNIAWSQGFLNFKGLKEDFTPFEHHRDGLKKVDLSKSWLD